ncbi:MAG: glycosyltransferase family 2 protein [Armatimonadota bacterium]|nr:glycosyltransferase family 2 protein [Armatimonadota bacterium]
MTDPQFTLIVPSYNGGGYLRQCIESIQAQTYDSFTLAVLDDGSTDGSMEWLRGIGDPRVTIYPAREHLGIVRNWARARDIPKAEFMMIIGQDDLLDPNYLAVMDALTRTHPGAGLYHAHFRFINGRGGVTRSCRPLPARETAGQYLAALFTGKRDTYGTGYLMRSTRYEAIGGIPPFEKLLLADDALWMALMLGSEKVTARDECFSCRLHARSVSGGTEWGSWLAALPPYTSFLANLAGCDGNFAQAFKSYAPGYFQNWGRLLYTLALTQATRQNRRVDGQARQRIAETLAQIAPCLPPAFDPPSFAAGNGMRAREWINRSAMTRGAYNAYVRLRYGRE